MENTPITGWEIVPYIPTNNKHSNFVELDATVHAQIFEILTDIVKKSAAPLKEMTSPNHEGCETRNDVIEAAPVSCWCPEGFDIQSARTRVEKFIAKTSSSQPSDTKSRNASILAGEVLVSFDLPDDFPANGVDLDKLALPEEKKRGSISHIPRQYTFTRRLNGWKMERRQRNDGRYDKYYHHLESNSHFRSVVEVVNFLLYEENPKKQMTTPNKNNTPVGGSGERKRRRSEQIKTKKPPPPANPNSRRSGNRPEETSIIRTVPTSNTNVISVDNRPIIQYSDMYKKFVENYLAVAYNNFQNNPDIFENWSSNTAEAEVEERCRGADNELRQSVSEMMATQGAMRSTKNSKEEKRHSTKISKQTRPETIVLPMEADIGNTSSSGTRNIRREGSGQEVKSRPVVENLDSAKAEKTTASSSPGDLVTFANFVTQVEIEDVFLEEATVAENAVIHERDNNLAVLSSIEEFDLINHIPIGDIAD